MNYYYKAAITLLVLLLLTPLPYGSAQETDPAEKGKRIGTIVSAAIDTIAPGGIKVATQIISSLFGNKDSKKISKAEAEAAIKKAEERAEKALKAQVSAKLKGLKAVSDELDIVNQFLEPVSGAKLAVLRIETLLLRDGEMDYSDWLSVGDSWLEVERRMKIIDKIPTKTIDVRADDAFVKAALKRIKSLNSTRIAPVSARLKEIAQLRKMKSIDKSKVQAQIASLNRHVSVINQTLSQFDMITATITADMLIDLNDLATKDFSQSKGGNLTSAEKRYVRQRKEYQALYKSLDTFE